MIARGRIVANVLLGRLVSLRLDLKKTVVAVVVYFSASFRSLLRLHAGPDFLQFCLYGFAARMGPGV